MVSIKAQQILQEQPQPASTSFRNQIKNNP